MAESRGAPDEDAHDRGAEIPTYDPVTRRAFVVNAGSATVDVLDLRNPRKPAKLGSLDIVADLAPRSVGSANSVDTRFGILAVAVEADPRQDDDLRIPLNRRRRPYPRRPSPECADPGPRRAPVRCEGTA